MITAAESGWNDEPHPSDKGGGRHQFCAAADAYDLSINTSSGLHCAIIRRAVRYT